MANSTAAPADFTGARGSNAGDQFHELWALYQILQLMKPENGGLSGITVEGIGADSPAIDSGSAPHRWEGVDCALFYDGATMEDAARIDLVQLKYSASNPSGKWSVARLCENTKISGNNSVIRRLADDFTEAKSRAKDDAKIRSRLVSNQAIAPELKAALTTKVAPAAWDEKARAAHTTNRDALRKASGLGVKKFQAFVDALDMSGCGTESRHLVGLDVVEALASVLGDDVLSEVSQLRTRVRDLMLPEGLRAVTVKDRLLHWFGIYGWEGLFPARPSLSIPTNPIPRAAADEVARYFLGGDRLVLLHGEGGSGKTTLSQQVLGLLPRGSIQIVFDCFGGGSYMYVADKRHRAEKAFLQLTNDLAVASDCPVFVPRSGTHEATIETFLDRLTMAAKTLEKTSPGAFLLVIVDAADNSVTASQNANPRERPFVWDLAELDLASLPSNVRLLVSSRTSRLGTLLFSSASKRVRCDAFTLAESAQHLHRSFPSATDDQVGQFHALTGGNPRVQAYALSVAGNELGTLFSNLLPNGRTLPDVLEALFKGALENLGQPQVFEKLTASLAVLPAPADLEALAAVGDTSAAIVRDFALDLKKGLLISGDTVTIADEDFEKYVGDRSTDHQDEAVLRAAEYLWAAHKSDIYAATHVVHFLIRAGRQKDVFAVLDGDSSIAAVIDPVVTREIQNARLSLALASCRQSGDLPQELKTVLLGAMARHDEGAFFDVIEKEIDLSSEFSSATIFRRILIDRDRTADQGSALAHFALAAARDNDRTTTIQYLDRYYSWIHARQNAAKTDPKHKWSLADEDVAALIEAWFWTHGAYRAYQELNRWRPLPLRLRVAQIVVPRLIMGGGGAQLLEALMAGIFRAPFDLTLAVSLQQAGHDVPDKVWSRSFKAVRRAHLGRQRRPPVRSENAMTQAWLGCLLLACEIAVHKKLPKAILRALIRQLEQAFLKQNKSALSLSDPNRVDTVVRTWLLRGAVDKKDRSVEAFLKLADSLIASDPRRQHKGKRRQRNGENDARRDQSRLSTVHQIYSARLALMELPPSVSGATTSIAIPSTSYDFDSGYDSIAMRHTMAMSASSLAFLPAISAKDLLKLANKLVDRRYQPTGELAPDLALVAPLALREDFHAHLIKLINVAAADVSTATIRATEKVATLVGYSRFLLPISPRDSGALFNQALTLAKDIDDEAIDQLAFVSKIAPLAYPDPTVVAPVAAHRLATFAAGASLRLYGSDLFDWGTVVEGLTIIDPATSLASLSRWSDEGAAHLATTLSGFIEVALDRKVIDPRIAVSLAQSGAGITSKLLAIVVPAIDGLDATSQSALREEISRILLTEEDQTVRCSLGSEYLDLLGDLDAGPLTRRLRDTVAFAAALPKPRAQPAERYTPLVEQALDAPPSSPKPERFVPNVTDLSEIIRSARERDSFAMAEAILSDLAAGQVLARDRVDFLGAIVAIDREVASANDWGRVLNDLLLEWASPAIRDWSRMAIPNLIRTDLASLAKWLPYRHSPLDILLERSGLSSNEQIDALLAGIAEAGPVMESKVLFALAERVVVGLSTSEADQVLDWYLRRLEDRIPADDRSVIAPRDTPTTLEAALGRFFFALFSDIDTRIRWSAGHSVRVLARTGETAVIDEIYRNFNRMQDDGFRTPSAPFYWLAGRLWAGIVAYRIAFEAPMALDASIPTLVSAAVSSELPHAAIREVAKRAVLELSARGLGALDEQTLAGVRSANTPTKSLKPTREYRPFPSFDRTRARASRRFNFDEMDTIPYWYNDLLHIFPRAGQERILALAETWIIDKWRAPSNARRQSSEARRARLRDGDYSLTMNRHGALPTVEEYGTYLEWHAMLAVAGELLATDPVSAREEGSLDPFEQWLNESLPTNAPYWLADLRGPTPLELPFWCPHPKHEVQWLRPSSIPETLAHGGIVRPDDWIVVSSQTVYRSEGRYEEVSVDTALVSEPNADALVRSFQTNANRYDTYLPTSSGESFGSGSYQLKGWLARVDGNTALDEHDGRRYCVRQQEMRPGRDVSERLSVKASAAVAPIEYGSAGEPVFRYEAWDDEPSRESRHHQPSSASSGYRLMVTKSALQTYLNQVDMSLVVKIAVERRTHKSYASPYDESSRKKEYWKTFTLTPGGKIRDGVRDIGTWKTSGRRTRRRRDP